MNVGDEFVELESVFIELELKTPELKEDIKSFVLSILKDLNIDPALNLYSLSYAALNESSLVQKITVYFKDCAVGDKFFKKINEEYYEKIENISKNLIYDNHDLTADFNESICIIDENYAFVDTFKMYSDFYCKNSPVEVQKANKNLDNQLKNESFDDIDNADASSHIISAEDSKFDKENVANIVSSAETLSFFSKTNSSWNKKLEDYNIIDDSSRVQNLSLNNEKISSSLENEDNQVILDFISNRRIDEPMLNSILIFFENQQASDGGEIVDFKLQNSKDLIDGSHKLSIRYKSTDSVNRVLKQGFINFQNYKFEVRKSVENELESLIDQSIIILSDCNENYTIEIVRLLAENLNHQSSANEIEMVLRSCIFINTFIVKYKSDVKISEIRENFNQFCKLTCETRMKLFQIESTKTLIVRPIYDYMPEQKALSKFNDRAYQKEYLTVIEFDSDGNLLDGINELESSLNSKEYILEKLYSNQLLDTPTIKPLFDEKKHSGSKNSLLISLVLVSYLMLYNILINGTCKKKFEEFLSISDQMNDDLIDIQPFILINQECYSNLNILNYFIERNLDKLAEDLLQIDTKVSKLQNGKIKLSLRQDIDPKITLYEYEKIKGKWILELEDFFAN